MSDHHKHRKSVVNRLSRIEGHVLSEKVIERLNDVIDKFKR
ncbi:hypothetical protein VQL36_14960 [Chengkuizengella sp. SCS-71B]